MATYNGARFLSEQLDSIVAQTIAPHEVVISDDASSDGTLRIVETFAEQAPFTVIVLRNSDNVGSTANFQRACEHCSGDFIAFCDQDDVWLPNKLATISEQIDPDHRTSMVFTDAAIVDASLAPLGGTLWQALKLPPDLPSVVASERRSSFMLSRPVVTGATMVVRRDVVSAAMPFPIDIKDWIHDRWIAAFASVMGKVKAIQQPTILYRQHDGQQIGSRPAFAAPASSKLAQNAGPLQQTVALADRLISRAQAASAPFDGPAFDDLRRMRDHCAFRLGLPVWKVRRIAPIMKEWSGGAYERYSSGTKSALKDLVL